MKFQNKNKLFLFSFLCFFVFAFLSLAVFVKVEVARSTGETCGGFLPDGRPGPGCANGGVCIPNDPDSGSSVGICQGNTGDVLPCCLGCPDADYNICAQACFRVRIGTCYGDILSEGGVDKCRMGACVPYDAGPDDNCTDFGGIHYTCTGGVPTKVGCSDAAEADPHNECDVTGQCVPVPGCGISVDCNDCVVPTYGCDLSTGAGLCVPNGADGDCGATCVAPPTFGCNGLYCDLNGIGLKCTSDANCDGEVPTGYCEGNACLPTGTGAACTSDANCSGEPPRCTNNNTCEIGGIGDTCTGTSECVPPNNHCNTSGQCVFEAGFGIDCSTNGSVDCAILPTSTCDGRHRCVPYNAGGARCDIDHPLGKNYDCVPKFLVCSTSVQACIESTSPIGRECFSVTPIGGIDQGCPCINGTTEQCGTCGGQRTCTAGVWGPCDWHRVCKGNQCKCENTSGSDECSDDSQCSGTPDCDINGLPRDYCGDCGTPTCPGGGAPGICREFFDFPGTSSECTCANGANLSHCVLEQCILHSERNCTEVACGHQICLPSHVIGGMNKWGPCVPDPAICPVNAPPYITDLDILNTDLCPNGVGQSSVTFRWNYMDLENIANPSVDQEVKYEFQMDDDIYFNSPDISRTVIVSSPMLPNITTVKTNPNPTGVFPYCIDGANECFIAYNTAYYIRVKVWENVNGTEVSSEWYYYNGYLGIPWKTGDTVKLPVAYTYPITHPAPYPLFTIQAPDGIEKNVQINFIDGSLCYTNTGGQLDQHYCRVLPNPPPLSGSASYTWFIGTTPFSAAKHDESYIFTTSGTYSVKLTITDEVGFCSTTLPVEIPVEPGPGNKDLPNYKEISPF